MNVGVGNKAPGQVLYGNKGPPIYVTYYGHWAFQKLDIKK
jgi:hypothetical protein